MDSGDYRRRNPDETPWGTVNDTAFDRTLLNNGQLPDPDLTVYEALGITRQDHNVVFSVRQDTDDLRRLGVEDAHVQAKPDYSINADVDVDDELLDRALAKKIMPLKMLRQWLVVPICLLYFGGFLTSFFTMQQFVYRKIQQEQYPNVTFNDSIPVCNVNESDPNYILQTNVQQKSAIWMLYLGLASGIPAIFSNLVLGSYTDRFGRKYLFYLASTGSFASLAINAIGIYVDFPLYGFIPSFLLDGLTGSGYVIVLVSFSYIADITQAGPSRTFRITLIEFSIGLGSAAFSVLAGYLVQHVSFFWTMISAASIIALTILLVVLLPESYPKEKRAASSTTPCSNVVTALTFFFGRSNAGKRWMYNVLILTFFLCRLKSDNIETLYQLNNPFCWNPVQISWYMACSSALLLVGAIVVKPLQRVLTAESIAILGCVSTITGYAIEGLAQNSAMLYIGKYCSLSL